MKKSPKIMPRGHWAHLSSTKVMKMRPTRVSWDRVTPTLASLGLALEATGLHLRRPWLPLEAAGLYLALGSKKAPKTTPKSHWADIAKTSRNVWLLKLFEGRTEPIKLAPKCRLGRLGDQSRGAGIIRGVSRPARGGSKRL